MLKKHLGKTLPSYCVYAIRNTQTNQFYVSHSVSTGKTFKQEISFLRRGTHKCRPLQEAYSQLGEGQFLFEVLQSAARSKVDTLGALQQKWMRKIFDENSGLLYNQEDLEDLEASGPVPRMYQQPKRSNPSPRRTDKVIKNMFEAASDLPPEPLAKKDCYVKVGQSIYDYLYSLPQRNRINLMRQAITDAVLVHQQQHQVEI